MMKSKNVFRSVYLTIAFFMLIGPPVTWAKVYKWVDKNGQVHYSQVPPANDQLKSDTEVAEKSGGNEIPVSRKGDYAYCGDMKLPGPLYEPKKILLNLGNREESWQRSMRESEQSLERQLKDLDRWAKSDNRYSSSNYNSSAQSNRNRTVRRIKEYRCALTWAKKQRNKYADIKHEITSDLKGAKTAYQDALDAAHSECGYEPKNYSDPDYADRKRAWKKCMRTHDRRINASKGNLRTLRNQAQQLD